MKQFSSELIEKAKEVKSAEEIIAVAKENDIIITEDEANEYFAQLHPVEGEISDNELDNVAGGGCQKRQYKNGMMVIKNVDSCCEVEGNIHAYVCRFCGGTTSVMGNGHYMCCHQLKSCEYNPCKCSTCKHMQMVDGTYLCSYYRG